MTRVRQVAVIVDAADPYDRKVISGVADYAKEIGNWSLYVEVDPLQKLPDLRTWQGHGIIASFDDRKVAVAVRDLRLPVVGLGGGYGWYDPAARIPYFASNQEAIARLAAEHLLDRGFRRLAFYGYPRTRLNGWSEERETAFGACRRSRNRVFDLYRPPRNGLQMDRTPAPSRGLASHARNARGLDGLQRRMRPARA